MPPTHTHTFSEHVHPPITQKGFIIGNSGLKLKYMEGTVLSEQEYKGKHEYKRKHEDKRR